MLGTVIQAKRKELGYTQQQLADMLNVTAPAVNKWEKDLSCPDVELLAPLARILKTDLNELFSFYEVLSDKDREVIIRELQTKTLFEDKEIVLSYLEEISFKNPRDGRLFYDIANALYAAYLINRGEQPRIYLEESAEYYEKALNYINDDSDKEEIIYSLLTVYSDLGYKEKAENAWTKMPSVKYEKDWAHAEMLCNLEDYDASIPEIKEIILRNLVDLAGFLSSLYDAYRNSGDDEMAEYTKNKFKEFREVFGLWDGFGPERNDVNMFEADGSQKLAISTCPLFSDVILGQTDSDDFAFIDIIDKLMKHINKM